MSWVTYHGPRPELVPSLPLPIGDIFGGRGGLRVVRHEPGRRASFWRHLAPVFLPGRPLLVPVFYALGLAVIRRRPSPWFTVRLERGEWAAALARLRWRPLVGCDCAVECASDLDEDRHQPADSACPACQGRGLIAGPPFRDVLLAALQWNRAEIGQVYVDETKVLLNDDDTVAYAPPGWRRISPPEPRPLAPAELNDRKGIL